MTPVAALYIDPRGPYPKLLGPEMCWDEARDARTYAGPWPVVAHPPCERWGRYWGGGPMLHGTPRQKKLGEDGGCFAAALRAVDDFGGVLEHPEASHARPAHGLTKPPKTGGWISTGRGWTCCVEQGHYGHRARKATWLYYAGPRPPELIWGASAATLRIDPGYHSAEERRRAVRTGSVRCMGKPERIRTPVPFAQVLIELARASAQARAA